MAAEGALLCDTGSTPEHAGSALLSLDAQRLGGCALCVARWRLSPCGSSPSPAGGGGSGRRGRLFTPCDVRLHASAEDAWLSADGRVFDVTPFLGSHPGGRDSLLMRAGRDCTADFEFHSSSARRRWSEFQVGNLVSCARADSWRTCGGEGGGYAIS